MDVWPGSSSLEYTGGSADPLLDVELDLLLLLFIDELVDLLMSTERLDDDDGWL